MSQSQRPTSQPNSDAVALAKKQLRQRVRAALRSMTDAQRRAASAAACERVARLPAFAAAKTIMLYLPLPGEVDCTVLLQRCLQRGQTASVPRVDWKACAMEAVTIATLDDAALVVDERGLRTPRDGEMVSPNRIDVVIVPGIAFDKHGHRLGRAGGFYDRFLARLSPSTLTIGLAFEAQIVEDLPIAGHDVALKMIATEARLIQP